MDLSNQRGTDEKIIALLDSIESKSGVAEVTLPSDLAVTANVEFPEVMPVSGTVGISGTVPVSIAGIDGGTGSLPVAVQGTVPVSVASTLPVAVQGTVPVSGTVAISGTVNTNGAIQIASVQHAVLTIAAGGGYTPLPNVPGKGYVIISPWNASSVLRITRNGGTTFCYLFDGVPYTEPILVNANELSLRRDDAGAAVAVTMTIVTFA